MNDRTERLLSGLLTLAALVIAAAVAKREFFPAPVTQVASLARPTYMPQWRDALPVGVAVGDTMAAIKVVELSDLECPACRAFHRALGSVLAAHGKDVSAVFVHYPLAQHRFAMAAARAVECAAEVGQFAQLVASFYDKQDSLGLKSWGSYAREAHIRDTTSIAKCATSSARVARVEAGLAYGNRIGVQFTPTIIINGWRLAGTPSQLELERIVQALLKGEVPFDTSARVSD